LQYVELGIVRHAAILAAVEGAGQNVGCEAELQEDELPGGALRESALCGRPAATSCRTPRGRGGQDAERRPAMFCRYHLEGMIGRVPEEQPAYRRAEAPPK
jgi:hypothetical protein